MRYHAKDQIRKIFELQNEAENLNEKAILTLYEADVLIEELKKEIGVEFVYEDGLLGMEYMAIGMGETGNRDWLVRKRDLKIIE